MQQRFSLFWATLSVIALCASGCGGETETSSGGDTGGATCFDYTKFDGTTPMVSFKTDVLPLFRNSCGVGGASCHGDPAASKGQLYLGPQNSAPEPTQTEIDDIVAGFVGASGVMAPNMKVVVAGDASKSYLMHKMDGTLKCADLTCGTAGCGQSMPTGGALLSQAERDKVRRWIIQGATSN